MNEPLPFVSIICPVYNAENTIDDCIKSVLNQSFQKWEMICINDGSTDNTASILNGYAKKDSRIKVFHKKNGGVSSARNVGLQHTSNTSLYTHFLDSDDYICPDTYFLIYNAITKADKDIDYVRLFAKSTKTKYAEMKWPLMVEQEIETIYTPEEYFKSKKIGGMICNLFIKTAIAKTIRFDPDLYFMEDQLFSISCALKAKNIAFFPPNLYYYYQSENSASHTKKDLSNNIERLIEKVSGLDKRIFFKNWVDKSFLPTKANMLVNAKITYFKNSKKASPITTEIPIFKHLSKKNKIFYIFFKVITTLKTHVRNK